MPENIVGPQVRKLRNERGWSQEELAGHLQRGGWDISRSTLSKIEAQIRCVSDDELPLLARALDVSIDELYPPQSRRRRS